MDIFTMRQLGKAILVGWTGLIPNVLRQYVLLVIGFNSVSPSDTQPIYSEREACMHAHFLWIYYYMVYVRCMCTCVVKQRSGDLQRKRGRKRDGRRSMVQGNIRRESSIITSESWWFLSLFQMPVSLNLVVPRQEASAIALSSYSVHYASTSTV